MKTFYSFPLIVAIFTALSISENMNIIVTAANSSVEFFTSSVGELNGTFLIPTVFEETNYTQFDNGSRYNGHNASEIEEGLPNYISQNSFVNESSNDVTTTDTIHTDEIHDRCSAKLYSCQNRCNTAPRLACSCHMTCKVYGNCCEDFKESCPILDTEQEQKYGTFLQVDVQCLGNIFLIASCGHESVPVSWTENITIDGEDWRRKFDDLGTEDVVSRCHKSDSDEPVHHAPVTDKETRLHFKNIFCAVCNGVLDLELWHGLTHCKHEAPSNATKPGVIIRDESPFTNRTSLPDVEAQQILSSDKCQTFWRPKSKNGGNINPCLHEMDTKHPTERSNELMLRSHTVVTEEEQAIIEESISEKYSSLHLEWRNVKGVFGEEFNQSFFQEKCETLNSFVEHPTDPSSRYKNKYCFMLDGLAAATHKFCEPSLTISDDNGLWYTVVLSDGDGTSGNARNATSPGNGVASPGNRWVVYEGIEELIWDDLVTDTSISRCDGKTALVFQGECRRKSFYLTMKTNFTFVRSSLIRGDFNAQVDKFTDLLVETFVDKVSNRTACVVVSFEHSKVQGSSLKYQSSAEFQCLDIHTDSHEDSTVATHANLMHGGSISDDDVNHYIIFVTNTLKIVVEKEKAVTLPVTIELSPCIFPDKDADDKVRGYCTSVKNVWRAARKINELIGGLSLEGILTIICCILSVFGLVIRLALQNVVPFYKSYPGKIQFGLCLSLFLAYALFMLGGLVREGSNTCTVLAVFTHVAFLSALFWMNVTAFEIWRTFRTWRNQVVSRGHVSLILSVFYAVGIPLLIMMTALLVEEFMPESQFSPSYGEHDCWLNGSMAVAFYFVTPCCIICCINAIFVGLTLRSLRRQRTSISEFKKSNATTAVTDVGIVIKIILLVGITWLLGLLAALVDNEWLWILFTVINASLGFLISVVLVFNKRVYYTVRAKCLCYNNDAVSVVSTQVQRH